MDAADSSSLGSASTGTLGGDVRASSHGGGRTRCAWRLYGWRATLMSVRHSPRRRGSYGLDAPFAPLVLASIATVLLAMAILAGRWKPFFPAVFVLVLLGFYLHTTLRGKFVVWSQLLDDLHLQGDERILDMGCGRGAAIVHGSSNRCRLVAACRSVRQLRRGRPAKRPRRGSGRSGRVAHGRHEGSAVCGQRFQRRCLKLGHPQHLW